MGDSYRVLVIIVDPTVEADIRQKLAAASKASFLIQSAPDLQGGLKLLATEQFDVVLADVKVLGAHRLTGLAELNREALHTPTLIISEVSDETRALEAVRAGAEDYLLTSRMNTAALERVLLHTIERQLARKRATLQFSVSRVLAESESLPSAAAGVLRTLCATLKFDFGEFWKIDATHPSLLFLQSWHHPLQDDPEFASKCQAITLSKGQGLPGQVWESGATAWDPDGIANFELPRASVPDQGSDRGALAFPVMLGNEVLGVIELFGPHAGEPDRQLLKTLSSIGNQVGQFVARKLAEEEREQFNKDRLLILDSTSEGIYGVDRKGCLTFMNKSAATMLRCVPDEVLGRSSHELFHHTRADGSPYAVKDCPISLVFETGQGCHVEKEYFWRADGSHFTVDYTVLPVVDGGKGTGAVISFRDMTEKSQLEVELRHAQKLEAVGRLAAGMAHEINTPIQFVGDNLLFLKEAFRDLGVLLAKHQDLREAVRKGEAGEQLLLEVEKAEQKADFDYLRAEAPKAIEQALDGITRVTTIVRAMREFSHVDHSTEKTAADLNKALDSTLTVGRNEWKYVADVETEFGELPPVMCHLGDINQVFLNLLINSAHSIQDVVKESGSKGRIRIVTRREGESVVVAISDTGTGIPDEVRGRIFDPFFTTKGVGKGTGQGLALARAIVVEKHGGSLTFETEVGKGTTFQVKLPVNGSNASQTEMEP